MSGFSRLHLVAGLLALALAGPVQAAPVPAKRPFTVADSIAMTRIVDPFGSEASPSWQPQFKISPDGRRVAIVVRRGNLQTMLNDYELRLYELDDIAAFLKAKKAPLPRYRTLLQLSSAVSESGVALEGIRELRWLDDRHLAYVGQPDGATGQVFRLDIASGAAEQLSHAPGSVINFDLEPGSPRLLYQLMVLPRYAERTQPAMLVGNKSVNELMGLDREGRYPPGHQYYVETLGGGAAAPVDPAVAFPAMASEPFLSPDGRWAIVQQRVMDTDLQRQWLADYPAIAAAPHLRGAVNNIDAEMQKPSFLFTRFMVIDTSTRTVVPALGAPAAEGVGGWGLSAAWMPDGETVILGNTLMPLEPDLPAAERARRAAHPAVVALHVPSGRYTRLVDWGSWSADDRPGSLQLTSVAVSPAGVVSVSWKRDGTATVTRRFERTAQGWQELTGPPAAAGDGPPLVRLSVEEGPNTPPELWATDPATGVHKPFSDLNPALRQRALGHHEAIHWQDGQGRRWQAGLVYPPDFKPGKRYPLVIQTHGYNPRAFLVDGPGTASAFAARPLANQGMLVAQLGEQHDEGFNKRPELLNEQTGVETLIAELDRRGLIDRTRVGLIGWSTTGVTTLHNITFARTPIAAATIADSYGLGLFNYAVQFGLMGIGMLETEQKIGAVPWGDQRDTWVAHDVSLNTDRIKTPLRIEQYAQFKTVPGVWDIYALLKRRHKPVEFLWFPNGTHDLVKPAERLASQQGNVDWFRFWLKGEEDPDPAKAEQYARWRKLSEQHERDLSVSEAAAPQ